MTNNASIHHFNQSAADWDKRPTSEQLKPLPEKLLKQISLNKNDIVLDFGAGTGLLSKAVAPFVKQVTALDMSANMLAVLDAHQIENIRTLEHDIFLGMDKQYTLIISSMAMHHVENTEQLFKSFYQALTIDGRLALVDFYQEDGTFHGDNVAKGVKHFGFEPTKLSAIAKNIGFKNIQFSTIHELHRDNGRTYPLFLMQATKHSTIA